MTAGSAVLATATVHAASPTDGADRILRTPLDIPVIRFAQAATPGSDPANGVQWKGARYDSLAALIEALQAGRYTSLMFKRISADLRRGRVTAMSPLLERFYKGRWRRNLPSETPISAVQLLRSVAEDTRAAIAFANTSSDLAVPEYMVEPVTTLAQRLAHKIYRLPGEAPTGPDIVPVPKEIAQEEQAEPKARAENTGLYHDAVDFVQQVHLQFLVGGDALTVQARLLSEVLKIARSDNLLVDDKTVFAFVDRLVEAGVVGPEQRDRLADRTLSAFRLKTEQPKGDLIQSPAPPPADLAVSNDTAKPQSEQQSEPEQPLPDSPVVDTEVVSQGGSPLPEATPPVTEVPPARPAPNRPVAVAPAPVARPAVKGDLLIVAETGLGISLPAQNGDLDPLGQSVDFDPGIAARFGLGAIWPEALGPAHLGLSLVGVVGRTEADRLSGVAGPGVLNTSGSNSYVGVMPFVSVELPVSSGINVRLGGGLGVAYQSLEVLSGTTKLVDADGVSFMAQLGGGLRFALSPCIDWGMDVFATRLDSVKGTGIGGAAVKFAGAWDVAAYATVRVGFGSPRQKAGCRLFAP